MSADLPLDIIEQPDLLWLQRPLETRLLPTGPDRRLMSRRIRPPDPDRDELRGLLQDRAVRLLTEEGLVVWNEPVPLPNNQCPASSRLAQAVLESAARHHPHLRGLNKVIPRWRFVPSRETTKGSPVDLDLIQALAWEGIRCEITEAPPPQKRRLGALLRAYLFEGRLAPPPPLFFWREPEVRAYERSLYTQAEASERWRPAGAREGWFNSRTFTRQLDTYITARRGFTLSLPEASLAFRKRAYWLVAGRFNDAKNPDDALGSSFIGDDEAILLVGWAEHILGSGRSNLLSFSSEADQIGRRREDSLRGRDQLIVGRLAKQLQPKRRGAEFAAWAEAALDVALEERQRQHLEEELDR